MKKIIVFFFTVVLLSACKQDVTAPQENASNALQEYNASVKALASSNDKSLIQKFMALTRKVLSESDDKVANLGYLEKGLQVAEKNKMGPTAIGFLMVLLKDYPENEKGEENLAKLSSALHDIGKSIPGDVLIDAYLKRYPEGSYASALQGKQKEKIADMDAYIKVLAEKIFIDPDKYGINKVSAQKYVDACEAYAIGNPNSEQSPVFLYRASEMARTLKTFPKALNIYEWIEEKYPTYEKVETVTFLKGFMLENELKDKDAAKKVYNGFLAKYPDSKLKDDVAFLLENIDKTDEEIMKAIEAKSANQ